MTLAKDEAWSSSWGQADNSQHLISISLSPEAALNLKMHYNLGYRSMHS